MKSLLNSGGAILKIREAAGLPQLRGPRHAVLSTKRLTHAISSIQPSFNFCSVSYGTPAEH
jgi:hypothetical protein